MTLRRLAALCLLLLTPVVASADMLTVSTVYTRDFLMVATSDHLAGLTGASPACTLSKAGGTFAAAGGTITELANGWYKIALTTTDTNTLGNLAYHCTATSGDPRDFTDQVVAVNFADAVRAGLTALPNANAEAAGGLYTRGTGAGQINQQQNGQIDANLARILNTAVSTPATAGILDVNVKNMNNVAATSITAVNANQGTTQPVNFTGTAGSALGKSDMTDIAGAAVDSSQAQIGANVAKWAATTVPAPTATGIPDINVKNINNVAASSVTTVNANVGTTQPVNFTGTGASALAKSDVTDWNGTAVSSPATAGIPDVNVKNMNNVAATSVTTINANQGTTQPVNFTGTAGSALVKGDAVDINGTAQTTGTDVALNSAHLATATELNAGNYRFTSAALALAPTGGGAGNCPATLQVADAFVYGPASVVTYVFIRDTTTCQGLTGLTAGSTGLKMYYARTDQGNAAAVQCTPIVAATRGAHSDCGFVEKDATNMPGWYEVGLTNSMIAAGVNEFVLGLAGVSGMVPTVVKVGLVSTGLSGLNAKLGTPAGADMSADNAAIKAVADAVKAKTDQTNFASGDIMARVNTYSTGQAPLQPATAGRTIAITSAGSVQPDWAQLQNANAVQSLTGTTLATVTNLTNAPTAGDLTATMKTSVTTAASAATPASVVAGGTLRKNVASQNYGFPMLASDGSACVNKSVTVALSKDFGAFGNATGTTTETGSAGNGNGFYKIALSQADTNADFVQAYATASGCVATRFQFKTTP